MCQTITKTFTLFSAINFFIKYQCTVNHRRRHRHRRRRRHHHHHHHSFICSENSTNGDNM